jgi:LysR family transcriptional activator of nhaA
MYNYNHLFYFYITAKSGGVTNAAKHLRLSQPSLSSQLKILEQSLDMKLFNKVGRKNELTESGETIYGFCRKMFEFADEMNELVSNRMPSTSKRLKIGISEEVDRSFVVEVVSLFLKQQNLKRVPNITLVTGTREQLTDSLRFKELDILVSELAIIDPEVNKIAYAEIPVVLACSGNVDLGPLAIDADFLNPAEIIQTIAKNKDIHWVLPSDRLKLRNEIDNFLEASDITSQVALVTDSTSSLVRAVKDEIGFSFLPLKYITQELHEKSIQIVGPKSGHWKYRVWLICQQHNKNDEVIKLLSKSFNEICCS